MSFGPFSPFKACGDPLLRDAVLIREAQQRKLTHYYLLTYSSLIFYRCPTLKRWNHNKITFCRSITESQSVPVLDNMLTQSRRRLQLSEHSRPRWAVATLWVRDKEKDLLATENCSYITGSDRPTRETLFLCHVQPHLKWLPLSFPAPSRCCPLLAQRKKTQLSRLDE